MSGNIDQDELNFHKLLNALAGLCQYELDDTIISIYDLTLQKSRAYSYAKLCEAIEKIIVERNSRDPFPSVKQIAEIASGGRLKQKEVAVDVANTIVAYIGSKGYTWPQVSDTFQCDLRKALGEIGHYVVLKYGGWVKLCQDANKSDLTTFKAQLRDSALSVQAHIEKNGYLLLPRQEKIGVSDKIKGLVKNSLKSLKSMR